MSGHSHRQTKKKKKKTKKKQRNKLPEWSIRSNGYHNWKLNCHVFSPLKPGKSPLDFALIKCLSMYVMETINRHNKRENGQAELCKQKGENFYKNSLINKAQVLINIFMDFALLRSVFWLLLLKVLLFFVVKIMG